jgi:hypothetical protein
VLKFEKLAPAFLASNYKGCVALRVQVGANFGREKCPKGTKKTCTFLVTRLKNFGFFEMTRDDIATSKIVNEIKGSVMIAKAN